MTEEPEDIMSVGYVASCLGADLAVRGSHMVSDESPMWQPAYGADEHGILRGYNRSLGQWVDPTWYGWTNFAEQLTLHPETEAVWWMPVYTDDDWRQAGGHDPTEKLAAAYDILRSIWTGGPLFVSAFCYFGPIKPICKSSKDPYVDEVWRWINANAGPDSFAIGPTMPTLTAEQKERPAGVRPLGRCFPNPLGMPVWGAALVEFDWGLGG